MEDFIYIIVPLLVFLLIIGPLFVFMDDEGNISNFDISNAALINNFITYTKSGTPCYYLVYEFKDNSIKEFKVSSEIYYKNIKLNINKNEEGS